MNDRLIFLRKVVENLFKGMTFFLRQTAVSTGKVALNADTDYYFRVETSASQNGTKLSVICDKTNYTPYQTGGTSMLNTNSIFKTHEKP